MASKSKPKDGSDNRSKENFIADTATLLSQPVSNIHTRRALLYKVSEDVAKLLSDPWWTTAAWAKYCANLQEKEERNSKVNPYAGLHREHPVPRSVVTDWLCGTKHCPCTPVDPKNVSRAIELFMVTCWVTGPKHKVADMDWGSEQDVLDATWCNIKCKDNMPGTWIPASGGIWERYELVKRSSRGGLSDWKERSDHETCLMPSPQGPWQPWCELKGEAKAKIQHRRLQVINRSK